MTYGDLFVSVRQRRVAFTYYLEFFAPVKYGESHETDYLDAAYRFPCMTADEKFLRYCAKRDRRVRRLHGPAVPRKWLREARRNGKLVP